MSDIINNGGPAFPFFKPDENLPGFNSKKLAAKHFPGMTLRDWFAGMALQGYIASVTQSPDAENAAEACYRYADAMLIQREKGIKS